MAKNLPVKRPNEEKLLEALSIDSFDPNHDKLKAFKPFILPTLLVPPGAPGGNASDSYDDALDEEEAARGYSNRPHLGRSEGNTSVLYTVADFHHEGYVDAIVSISFGAAPKAAFMALGFPPTWVYRWTEVGKEDILADRDTYFARFTFDTVKALGLATRDAQIKIWDKRPDLYLSRGPGQAAGSEYADQGTVLSIASTQISNIALPASEPRELAQVDEKTRLVEVQKKMLTDMEGRGMPISQFIQAYDNQYGK